MYQGHCSDGSSIQKHSAGPLYPFVVYETHGGNTYLMLGCTTARVMDREHASEIVDSVRSLKAAPQCRDMGLEAVYRFMLEVNDHPFSHYEPAMSIASTRSRLTRKQALAHRTAVENLRALPAITKETFREDVRRALDAVRGIGVDVYRLLDDEIGEGVHKHPAFRLLRTIRNTPGLFQQLDAAVKGK